jgi:threonine dehydratase
MQKFYPQLRDIRAAAAVLETIMKPTPLNFNQQLSKKYNAKILEKREDLVEPVRSYKLRGAFNKMYHINKNGILLRNGIITCSAGNHAQGVAYSCNKLNINGIVFMPKITTKQKIDKVKNFGGKYVKIFLEGNNFDESFDIALNYSLEKKCNFIHPFDDEKVIEGQATVGLEIMNQMKKGEKIDYIFLPVGGGGLLAGVSTLIKQLSPKTKIIGLEPLGAPSMSEAIKMDKVIKLDKINSFVDGASVKKVGELNFPICKENLDKMLLVDEGHVCSKILEMYNESGYVIEPAGVLSLCGLDLMKDEIINKNVVCIISGGNSDVFRMPEILERSLLYEGKKQYFKIEFAQTAGALKEFIMSILGPNDDIIYFKYTKIINKETGPVIIGIETKSKTDSIELINKMNKANMIYEKLTNISDI